MKKLGLLVMGGAFLFLSTSVMAQTAGDDIATLTLDEMRLVRIIGTAPSLTFVAPLIAGNPIIDVTSEATYIQYSSVVDSAKTNKISVKFTGDMPPATELYVVAAAPAGGNGTYGTVSTERKLLTTDQVFLSAIGSVYTGTGAAEGHKLTYRWTVLNTSFANFKKIRAVPITVTYTIAATL